MESNELIEGLLEEKLWAFEALYQKNFKSLCNYVLKNSGTVEDAKDIFQETVIALMRVLSKSGFELNENTQLSSLVYSIGKRLWLGNLRKRKIKIVSTDISELNYNFTEDEAGEIERQDYESKHTVIEQQFKDLGEECRKLLELYYFKNIKLKKIAKIMSYTEAFVRIKKYRCMNTLKSKVALATTN